MITKYRTICEQDIAAPVDFTHLMQLDVPQCAPEARPVRRRDGTGDPSGHPIHPTFTY